MRLETTLFLMTITAMACGEHKATDIDDTGVPSNPDGDADADADAEADDTGEPSFPIREELPEDYLSLLTETMACSDTWMHMYSEDQTIGLTVYVPGIFTEADGGAHSRVTNLPHEDVRVTLEIGGNLSRNWCTDEMDVRIVSNSWLANYGTVTMFLDAPSTSSADPTGRFTFSGLDFPADDMYIDSYASPDMTVMRIWGG